MNSTPVADMAVTTEATPFLPWDNPDNIITAQTLSTIHKVVICGTTEVAMILGMPGNVLNSVVFFRQCLKDRITLMLFVLAIVDFFNLLFYFSISLSCFIHPFDPVLAWNVKMLQYAQVLYLNLLTGLLSIALVTVLSVDRCVAITWPLKAPRLLTYRRTVYVLAVTIGTVVAFSLPSLWLHEVKWVPDSVTGRSMAQLVSTDFALDRTYMAVLDLFQPALRITCLVGVVVSCSVTIRTLRMAREMRADMTESKLNQAEAKITVMLLFVSAVMIICLLPEMAFSTIYSLVPEFNIFRKYHNIFTASQYFVFLARTVNSASNFFMYLALSTKFRVTFLQLFPCCWHRAAEPKKLTEATLTVSVSTNQTVTL